MTALGIALGLLSATVFGVGAVVQARAIRRLDTSPDGFVGGMFKIIGRHVPPPAGVPSPMAWGTEDRLHELFGHEGRVEVHRREFVFRYRSPDEFFETFQTYYGPTVKAWAALDADGKASLRAELTALAAEANESREALKVPAAYVEVVVTRS